MGSHSNLYADKTTGTAGQGGHGLMVPITQRPLATAVQRCGSTENTGDGQNLKPHVHRNTAAVPGEAERGRCAGGGREGALSPSCSPSLRSACETGRHGDTGTEASGTWKREGHALKNSTHSPRQGWLCVRD